jgi:hypothetical protein
MPASMLRVTAAQWDDHAVVQPAGLDRSPPQSAPPAEAPRSPAPDRFLMPPGRSPAVCRSCCSNRTEGGRPPLPFGTREAGDELERLQAQTHLIAVILPR